MRWMVHIKLYIPGNKQIQQAIVIVIAPSRSGGPASNRHPCLFRDISEGPIVIVVIKPVLSVVGNVDIGPTVVVIVGHGHAESPAFIGDAGLVGYVGKCSIVIIVKEHSARCSSLAFQRSNGRTVEQVDVEPTVVIVIKKSHSRARSLEDRSLFWCAGDVSELIQPCLLRDIEKGNGRIVYKSPCGDWTMLRIFHRGVNRSGRLTGWHAHLLC